MKLISLFHTIVVGVVFEGNSDLITINENAGIIKVCFFLIGNISGRYDILLTTIEQTAKGKHEIILCYDYNNEVCGSSKLV